MQSQYVDAFLEVNAKRGTGKGLTPGSFLAYTLRGSAKRWISRYEGALVRGVKKVPGVVAGRSVRGRNTYYLEVKSETL